VVYNEPPFVHNWLSNPKDYFCHPHTWPRLKPSHLQNRLEGHQLDTVLVDPELRTPPGLPGSLYQFVYQSLRLDLGTAYSFRRKRFTITEGSGAFTQGLTKYLEREGVACIRKLAIGTDWDYNNF
jgi:hypothetical protein